MSRLVTWYGLFWEKDEEASNLGDDGRATLETSVSPMELESEGGGNRATAGDVFTGSEVDGIMSQVADGRDDVLGGKV